LIAFQCGIDPTTLRERIREIDNHILSLLSSLPWGSTLASKSPEVYYEDFFQFNGILTPSHSPLPPAFQASTIKAAEAIARLNRVKGTRAHKDPVDLALYSLSQAGLTDDVLVQLSDKYILELYNDIQSLE